MSTADAPLARLCSRQTCRRAAQATLTFVYSDSTAVIGPLSVHAEPHAYDLCILHAQRMTPPRGWEIVRLEGVVDSEPDDSPAAEPTTPVADSAPLAPLSTLPGGSAAHGQSGPSDEDASEDDVPGNSCGSAPSGRGRRRRARLRSVAGPAPEAPHVREAPHDQAAVDDGGSASADDTGEAAGSSRDSDAAGHVERVSDQPQGHDEASADQQPDEARVEAEPDDQDQQGAWIGSLSDEIFAGKGTELVHARARISAQPQAMRRPHLRRGRG